MYFGLLQDPSISGFKIIGYLTSFSYINDDPTKHTLVDFKFPNYFDCIVFCHTQAAEDILAFIRRLSKALPSCFLKIRVNKNLFVHTLHSKIIIKAVVTKDLFVSCCFFFLISHVFCLLIPYCLTGGAEDWGERSGSLQVHQASRISESGG